jgi:hypothetical protein
MSARTTRLLTAVSLAAAGLVLIAAIAQAIRQGSFDPIWQVGWLLAVVVAMWYRPGQAYRCWPRRPARQSGGSQ